ncbi:hypothetical protein F5884DRAFT_13413 [Xylogone sp. PMI_703]|nr:hypothetical protein F5884DRAFT_13413 [Xylogone sp. PMI_703]
MSDHKKSGGVFSASAHKMKHKKAKHPPPPPKKDNLSKLPAEILHNILHHCLVSDTQIRICYTNYVILRDLSRPNITALLLVCRAIHPHAEETLYRHNEFRIQGQSNKEGCMFLSSISENAYNNITHIEMAKPAGRQEDTKALLDLLLGCRRLQRLDITGHGGIPFVPESLPIYVMGYLQAFRIPTLYLKTDSHMICRERNKPIDKNSVQIGPRIEKWERMATEGRAKKVRSYLVSQMFKVS